MARSYLLSDPQFRSLIQNSTDIITILEVDGTVRYESPSVEGITGYLPEELIGRNIFEYIHPEDAESVVDAFKQVVSNQERPHTASFRFLNKDGTWCYLEVTGTNLLNDQYISGIVINSRNITDRKIFEQALATNEAKFRSLIQNSSDIITILDESGKIKYKSVSTQKILGYSAEELINQEIYQFCHCDDLTLLRNSIAAIIENPTETVTLEFRFLHQDSSYRYLEAVFTNLLDNVSVAGIVVNSRDVTERKKFEEQLLYNAYYDALTLLPNRKLFMEWLDHGLKKLYRLEDYCFAVLFLDLDRFKVINDSLGHSIGDKLLVKMGQRLQACIREIDKVSRFGGDEFAILVDNITELREAIKVAERIKENLHEPFILQDREIFCTASIGIALSTVDYDNPADIIRDADTALYKAKRAGKNRHEVFDADMHREVFMTLKVENDLRRALDNSEFQLYYQPIVALDSGKITAVEALIRWKSSFQPPIGPNIFIPIAEETGLIIQIGEWILRQACKQLCLWDQTHVFASPINLSINVSAKQFCQLDFVALIDSVLSETGLCPSRLTLEITETAIMENPEAATLTFSQLKAMGVGLSMDDFGTGYSSLSYLHRFPINSLKIDRSFISQMKPHDRNYEIIRTMIMLAANLNLSVVAEGIELQEQLQILQDLQCSYGQGYLFSAPVSADQINERLTDYSSLTRTVN